MATATETATVTELPTAETAETNLIKFFSKKTELKTLELSWLL